MTRQATHSNIQFSTEGREAELLSALNQAAASLQQSAHSEAAVFRAFKEQIAQLGLNGSISLLDETGERMSLHAVFFPGRMKLIARFEKLTRLKAEGYEFDLAGLPIYQQVIQTAETLFVPDGSEIIAPMLPDMTRSLSARILRAFAPFPAIVAPLVSKGDVRGLLFVSGAGLIAEDVSAIEAFANHISVALDNARLFAALQQSEANLKKSYDELETRVADRTAELTAVNESLQCEIAEREKAERNLHQAKAELEKQNARLESLYRAGQMINSTLEPDAILDRLTDEAMRISRASHGQVLVVREKEGCFERRSLRGFSAAEAKRAKTVPLPLRHGVNGRAYATHQSVCAHDVQDETDYFPLIPATRAELAVPIISEGRVLGNLDLQSPEVGAFRDVDLDYLSALADLVAIALDNAYLLEAARLQARQIETLGQLSQDLIALQDLDTLLYQIVERALQLMDAEAGGIYLYRSDRDVLEWVVAIGEGEALIGTTLDRGEGLSGKVWETGKPLIVDNYKDWPGRSPQWQHILASSVIGVPIQRGDDFLGVINLRSGDDGPGFTSDDIDLLSQFAAQAAIAIHNARLYQTERKWARQLAVVNQVARKAASILDPDRLLQEIVTDIQQGFEYYNVILLLLDPTTGDLGRQAVAGGLADWAHPGYRQSVGVGLIGHAAETGQAILANDVREDPRYVVGFEHEVPTRSEMCVPLILEGQIIGVLDVQETELNAFDETDLMAMQTLADQIAVAVKNARLYEAAQCELAERVRAEETLKQRNRELSTLLKATAAISSDLSLDAVLHTVAEQMAWALNTSGCTLSLWDREKNQVETLVDFSITWPNETESQGTTYDLTDYPVTRRALETGQPIIIQYDDPEADQSETALLEKFEAFTLLMLPLVARDQVLGLVELTAETEARDYTPEEVRVAQSLAAQAAIAIENAQLFGQAQQELVERRRAEKALRESEEKYRLLFERNLAGVSRTTLDGQVIDCNDSLAQILGYASREEVLASKASNWYFSVDEREIFFAKLQAQGMLTSYELCLKRKDQTPVWVLGNVSLIKGDEAVPRVIEGTMVDITERKRAEEQMRRQDRLAAVGQLAGGIAHDFNNMLTAINGFAELMQFELPLDHPLQELVEKILGSGRRAADLVRQLLAFSRKQIIEPQVLSLNTIVTDMDKMLRRIIGEDIEVKTVLAPDLWLVEVDPTQIEQVIVNLAVNARDAMPDGGCLTVETVNTVLDEVAVADRIEIQPGDYVLLAVSDTGVGMSEEIRQRIFEPFFTTKEVGKGTGLGLATVFGIIKQSGGDIWVYSEEGRGSVFEIYLPRAGGSGTLSPETYVQQEVPTGTESILLVEDDVQVRELARRVLHRQGYTLLVAEDGEEALQLAANQSAQIHLLLTDVVMPRMSGEILAEQLAQTHPDCKTLYMSGYTDDMIVQHGVLDPRVHFLQKPFTPIDLARKIRAVLDS